MKPLDMPPKTSRRLNQVKVMTNYTHSKHDNTLETTLIQWRQNVHAEFWGGKIDHFLGPVALISDEIIEDLCHLSHAHAIHTINDIPNNIQGAQCPFVMKHAEDIVNLIHSIIPLPLTTSSKPEVGLLPPNTPIQPIITVTSKWGPCNDRLPWRWESPQGPADLGSAIGLAPQSLGLLGCLKDGMGVS